MWKFYDDDNNENDGQRTKKVGALHGDSAGTLAYKKDWKIIDDSYAFSNAIRLIVFLITGKLVKFNQNAFCFFKIWFWIGHSSFAPIHFLWEEILFNSQWIEMDYFF